MAVEGEMTICGGTKDENEINVAPAERTKCSYVITGGDKANNTGGTNNKPSNNSYYALIDGNKTPKEMPCPCESMTKGGGQEYSIGATFVIAKVMRD